MFGRSSSSGSGGGNKKKNESEHVQNQSESNRNRHEEGKTRKQGDQGGRKAHKAGRVKTNPNTRNGRAAAAELKKKGKGGRG
jgi:hypothetical protein